MSILFGDNPFSTYKAHPLDMLYSLLMLGVGVVTMYQERLYAFGVVTFVLGTLLGISIILAINWEKVIQYWYTVDEFARTMSKVNNPELWEALGFTAPERSVKITEKQDHGQGFTTLKFHDAPVSPAIMQCIADAVLTGAPFSENEFVKRRKVISGPKFRKLQQLATSKDKQWARANSARDNRQGFSLTRKGKQVFYGFASQSVKMKLKEEGYKDASIEE